MKSDFDKCFRDCVKQVIGKRYEELGWDCTIDGPTPGDCTADFVLEGKFHGDKNDAVQNLIGNFNDFLPCTLELECVDAMADGQWLWVAFDIKWNSIHDVNTDAM